MRDDYYRECCEEILEETRYNSKFDNTFIASLIDQLDEGWELTDKQISALANIYKGWCKKDFKKK